MIYPAFLLGDSAFPMNHQASLHSDGKDCSPYMPLEPMPWADKLQVSTKTSALPLATGILLLRRSEAIWKVFMPCTHLCKGDVCTVYAGAIAALLQQKFNLLTCVVLALILSVDGGLGFRAFKSPTAQHFLSAKLPSLRMTACHKSC